MATFRKDKKEEDDGGTNMFQMLDKTNILQEVRYFNSNQVDAEKCIQILTKTLVMLNQGIHLTTEEATSTFFAITKLFQSEDVMMRRLVYLSIRELSTLAQDVIVVTSSLTKDMVGKVILFRAAAIRTLCSITDKSMLQSIERYIKQAIVDRNPAISSAALVSALHLSTSTSDVSQRWVNEALEVMNSANDMVPYHAFGVISASRKNDRLFMVKLVTKLLPSALFSPSYYTVCLLIRHVAKLAEDETEDSGPYIHFIESCLCSKSDMVIYEAASAIVSLSKNIRDLTEVCTVLQVFCASSQATVRYVGAQTLARLIAKHPKAVIICSIDLEQLIHDPNHTVAILAITTLLTTCNESSVERLMKKVSSFMTEISDGLEILVFQAIDSICSKYPRKQKFLVSYLSGMLQETNDKVFKTAIANAIIELVEIYPDAKDTGLDHLCEFIEYSNETSLAVRMLHVIGSEGAKVRQPSKYIRFIYNRILLDSGAVRAAAVSALARFGASCADLLPSIKVILERCQTDDDGEVRDRAVFYSTILDTGNQELINNYIANVPNIDFELLAKQLENHLNTHPEEPFNMDTIPIVENIKDNKKESPQIEPCQILSLEEQYAEQLKVIPCIEKFGPIFKTCEPIELTEPDTEYQVKCIKHVYAKHLILQFECLNTLSYQLLGKVHICLDVLPEYNLVCEVPCESIPYKGKGNIFCVLEFPTNTLNSVGRFGAVLEFTVYDCEPATGKPYLGDFYIDTYPLEDIEFGCSEQFKIQPASDDWDNSWESAESLKEVMDTFVMNKFNVTEVAKAMCKHLGLPESCAKGATIKKICGLGTWRKGIPVWFVAKIIPASAGAAMQLTVRCPNEAVASLLLAAIE
ncbi:PREDICTED: coatomer subunit gamma-2-like [Papilio xuthus]|uniref:Coatomer subunit gamma n=1 Tax=Papilio xuthus TaxID=66420 RepID=A0AAJ7E4H8_PAPXU|nr:PREDICTED: coatomer subunit gamma-2-like [Papilio xuthus]